MSFLDVFARGDFIDPSTLVGLRFRRVPVWRRSSSAWRRRPRSATLVPGFALLSYQPCNCLHRPDSKPA